MILQGEAEQLHNPYVLEVFGKLNFPTSSKLFSAEEYLKVDSMSLSRIFTQSLFNYC